MDESKDTDGSTAMERLCRELMDAVVSCAPTVWCGEHGIGIHGTRPEQDREHARADIERRIAEADLEDDKARDSALGDWKAKADAMDETCRALGVDSYNLAADAARSLAEERCELKELRGAGRVVPEGCRWPSFGDGGRLALGGEAWTKDGGRVRVVAVSHRGRAAVRPWGRKDGRGARWVPLSSLLGERPDPKAIGADGVEVKPGDTVWLAENFRSMAGDYHFDPEFEGNVPICDLRTIYKGTDPMTVAYVVNERCVSLEPEPAWCPASWLTHTAPCTDKDGAPIDEGDEVWTEDGCRWKVLGIKEGGHPVQAKCVEGCHRGKRRDLKWSWVSHECQDSWESLHEDVRKVYTDYWGCIGLRCDECPALVDGKNPSERYDTIWCDTAMQLDLVARAERLAGGEGR